MKETTSTSSSSSTGSRSTSSPHSSLWWSWPSCMKYLIHSRGWPGLAGTPRGCQHLTAAPTATSPQKIWHPLLPQPDTFNFGISNRQSPSASNVLQALWLLGITKEIEKFQEAVIIRIVNTVGLTLLAVRLQKHSSSTCP